MSAFVSKRTFVPLLALATGCGATAPPPSSLTGANVATVVDGVETRAKAHGDVHVERG